MGKPRMLGKTSGFIPNSQADRRKGNRAFQHREYQKKVEQRKEAEHNATVDEALRMFEEFPDMYASIQKACADIVDVMSRVIPDIVEKITEMENAQNEKEEE